MQEMEPTDELAFDEGALPCEVAAEPLARGGKKRSILSSPSFSMSMLNGSCDELTQCNDGIRSDSSGGVICDRAVVVESKSEVAEGALFLDVGDGIHESSTGEFAEICRSFDSRSLTYRFLKRLFDIVFSAVVIAIGLVPGALLSVFVALDTKGSPIYSQERIGRLGRPFRIYKFRTMVADSDDVEKYLNPDQLEQWRLEHKVDNDPRITSLGQKLRRTSLDEVPQFLNVFAGQMSVVGPRPVVANELNALKPEDRIEMLSVTSGVTGWWQVTARNDATWENGERQRLELHYVRNASVAMDIQVFARTFSVMFGKKKTGR